MKFWYFKLFSFLVVWGASSLSAQQVYKLSLGNTAPQVFSKDFYLESVEDARKEALFIGLVSYKGGGQKRPAVFERPLALECLTALRTLTISTQGKKPVRMRIRHLFIDEFASAATIYGLIASTGRATVELNASFEMQQEGVWSEVFRTNCFLIKENPDIDFGHSLNISEALAICWKKFNFHALSGKVALQAGRTSDTSLVRPRGIYPSYFDFLYQTPDSLDLSRISYTRDSTNSVIAAALAGDNESDPFAAWGFSDGHRLYVLCQNQYLPVFRTPEGLCIKGDRIAALTNILIGVSAFEPADLGGLQAIPLIKALLAEKKGPVNAPIYLLEPETGVPVCSPSSRTEVSTVHLIASDLLLDDARVQIRINGEEVCSLAPGQLYSLKIQSDHLHPLLEIQSGQNVYQTYLYPVLESEMVYLVRLAGKRKLSADILYLSSPVAMIQYKPNGETNFVGKAWPEPTIMQDIRQGKLAAPCAEAKP